MYNGNPDAVDGNPVIYAIAVNHYGKIRDVKIEYRFLGLKFEALVTSDLLELAA